MKTSVKIGIGIGSFIALGGLTYYFVFRKPKTDSKEIFTERFYDNDWVDGGEIGFLVPNPTKFKVGDKVRVVQDAGYAVSNYNGDWTVKNIKKVYKTINGTIFDSVETNCPYVKDTPVNGGTITLI